MEHLKPLDLLKSRLNEYDKALHKSFQSYQNKDIDLPTFQKHKNNLKPLIFEYKKAIQIIENWID